MIDPHGAPPPLEEPPADPPEIPDDRRPRRVAVLIMVVSLVGGIFAFLQTTSSNQAARATRRADIAAAEAMARLATGAGRIAAESRIWSLAYEDALVAVSLTGAGGDEAAAEAQAYDASRRALLAYTDLALPENLKPDGSVDWSGFVEEALAPSYRAAEYQKAYGAERDGWSAKGGAFVAMVTVLAVALFLLGLSRHLGGGRLRRPPGGGGDRPGAARGDMGPDRAGPAGGLPVRGSHRGATWRGGWPSTPWWWRATPACWWTG